MFKHVTIIKICVSLISYNSNQLENNFENKDHKVKNLKKEV